MTVSQSVDYAFTGFGVLFTIVVALIIYMIFIIKRQMDHFTDGRSYEDYKIKHPTHVKDGKVYCFKCNTHDIFLKQVGNTTRMILNSHVCRNCGIELYRSKMYL